MKSETVVLRCETPLTAADTCATGRFRGRRADRGVRLPPRGTAVIALAITEPLEPRRMLSVDASVAARLEGDGFAAMDWKGQEVYARPGRWIVRLDGLDGKPGRQLEAANARLAGLGESLRASEHLGSDGLIVVDAPANVAAPELEQSLHRVPGFRFMEPDFAVWADDFTADPSRGDLWGLHNVGQTGTPDADIDAPEAWSVQKGSASVVVGVIDSGIDYTHPDLASNIWHTPVRLRATASTTTTMGTSTTSTAGISPTTTMTRWTTTATARTSPARSGPTAATGLASRA